MLPAVVLANPAKKKKPKGKPKAAAKPKAKPKAKTSKPKAKPKAKPKTPKKKKETTTMAKKARSAKQEAATKKLVAWNKAHPKAKFQALAKARASRGGGKGHSKRGGGGGGGSHIVVVRNPPEVSNPVEATRGAVAAQVAGGVVLGGGVAVATDYLAGGTAMFATPGKRAALEAGIGALAVGGAIAVPKASVFLGTTAGMILGGAFINLGKMLFTGDAGKTSGVVQTGAQMGGVVVPNRMGGGVPGATRALPNTLHGIAASMHDDRNAHRVAPAHRPY